MKVDVQITIKVRVVQKALFFACVQVATTKFSHSVPLSLIELFAQKL